MVGCHSAKKIAGFPVPFPYAQLLSTMLLLHWTLAPCLAALSVENMHCCWIVTFATVFSFWCINYIAAELEMPFGDNPNDLPVEQLQLGFNKSLRRLMLPVVQVPPKFNYEKDRHGEMQYAKMAA